MTNNAKKDKTPKAVKEDAAVTKNEAHGQMSTNKELDKQLAHLSKDNSFEVVETFKNTPEEKTQKVVLNSNNSDGNGNSSDAGSGGGNGNSDSASINNAQKNKFYIRKEFHTSSGRGNIYKQLWEMQCGGVFAKNIAQIIDYYEFGELQVCILEFVEGQTLEAYVKNNNLTLAEIEEIFARLCRTLDCLHSAFDKPLIHRDIKPTNIIVNKNAGYNVTLIDFGIARFSRNDNMPDTTQLGTPSFAPPEQYGFGQTCIESDIYALGMVLYFMLTGKISQSTLRENSSFEKEILEQLQPILLKATAFDPAYRYHSAMEFLQAFQNALAGHLEVEQTEVRQANTDEAKIEKAWVGQAKARQTEAGQARVEQAKTVQAKTNQATTKEPKTEQTKLEHVMQAWIKLKHKYGFAWNIAVMIIWIWFILVCIFMAVSPDSTHTNTTLTSRLCAYCGCAGLFISTCAFLLLEKSGFKKKFGWMQALTVPKQIIIFCVVIIFACVFAALSSLV